MKIIKPRAATPPPFNQDADEAPVIGNHGGVAVLVQGFRKTPGEEKSKNEGRRRKDI